MFQAAEVRLLPLIFFAENGEKTWGELDCFYQCSIAENPYISRVFDARSSKQHWGFWISVAPVYIAAPRGAKLFLKTKKSFPDSEKELRSERMRIFKRNLCEMKRNLFRIFRLSASANRLPEERVKKSAVIQRKSSWKSVNYILISPWICAMIIPSRIMGG